MVYDIINKTKKFTEINVHLDNSHEALIVAEKESDTRSFRETSVHIGSDVPLASRFRDLSVLRK